MSRPALYRIGAAAVAVLLLLAGGLWYFRGTPTLSVAADFTRADGLFTGNGVDVLGLPVGRVTAIEPRGATVRVTMQLPADTRIPATAQAWLVTPSVVSEKHVELTPAYRGGPLLSDGAVIPAERTHAPLSWDELTQSLDTVLTALGPQGAGGSLGDALHNAATLLGGNGQKVQEALSSVTQASELLAGNGDAANTVLAQLNTLVQTVADNKSTVDSVSGSVSQAAQLLAGQRTQLSQAFSQLSQLLQQVSALVQRDGGPLVTDIDQLDRLSADLLAHQQSLVEVLDTAPLALDNFGRAVTPDDRLRIRLDISTNLSQVPAAQQLCAKLPIPLCSGAGITNPIPFPPDVAGALGLDAVLGGGTR